MRTTFFSTLAELATEDHRIVLLTGDLGYSVIEHFSEKHPDRFFNVGVAEQNMVGMATGLAEAGFIPFVYSIATFACLRPYEFIRNGPVLHHLPVRIVGVGGGVEYGSNGMTHWSLEDIGIMRLLPNLDVIVPADYPQMESALRSTYDRPGPIYYRISKDNSTILPGLNGRFRLSHPEIIREGNDLVMITMGGAAKEVIEASERLRKHGVDSSIVIISTISPFPEGCLDEVLQKHTLVITIENHYISGGLGTIISEIVASKYRNCRVVRVGFSEMQSGRSGQTSHLHALHRLDPENLTNTVLSELDTDNRRRTHR